MSAPSIYKNILFIHEHYEFVWNKFWNNANVGNYDSLNKLESNIIRNVYTKLLVRDFPDLFINGSKEQELYLNENTLLSKGYSRIVIGNHGPYIEFDISNILVSLEITKGQEWRTYDDGLRKVKYIWMNPIGFENVKIYKQIKEVSYADYINGMYYISPYNIYCIKSIIEENTLF